MRGYLAALTFLLPALAAAQGEFTAPSSSGPSGPAIVAPSNEPIYGPAQKPGAYKPPVAKPPTVPKPASSAPPVFTGDRPGIFIPTNPALPSTTPGGYVAPKPPVQAIPLPGQGPVIVKPAPTYTPPISIPLPGSSPPPAIPIPGTQPPIVIQKPPAEVYPKPTAAPAAPPSGPVTTTPPPVAPPSGPVTATPKPEPITSKPPATGTSTPTPPPTAGKPTEAPPGLYHDPRAEEEDRQRREALAAEAAMRARQEAAAAAERAKKGLAYPDVQPMTPGTAVNVAPQTEPPSSGAIKGLGAKIQQLQKEAAIPPKAPAAKPPANDCDPATPEQCAAIERQLERQKRRLQEELRRERERAEREQRRLDREAERRERNAERERNRLEREAQREAERKLGKDADDIGRERDRLEGRREARDSKSRELREQEQKLRRGGDPNCQSADCAKIRGQLTDLQKERQGDLKAETDLQRKGEKFDSEYRRHRAERDDLEKRLDRGEGLSAEEHKDRMEAKEKSRLAVELDKRMGTLDAKSSAFTAGQGPPLTRAEAAELEKLHGGPISGEFTAGETMRQQARAAAGRVDFDKLSGVSTGELRETARELGRAGQQLGDLEKRVGMGGAQPPAGEGAPSARETALQKERAKLNAAMESAATARDNMSEVAEDYRKAAVKADTDLREARKAGAPADEIGRLERRVTQAQKDLVRGNSNAERASRDYARASSGSESLYQREEAAALANVGGLAAGVVNDFNSSLGNLVDEKGNVRGDEVRKQAAQTERSLQQLGKAAPGSPEQKQAIDQLSRQGLDFQVDGGGKATFQGARTPYAGAVVDAERDAARLAALESKPAAQLTAQEKPDLQSLREGRAADREAVRRANQPAAAPVAAGPDNSLTGRFGREGRPGQTFQQWYAEEQQRVAGPATSPGQRLDAAEEKQRQAGAAMDREAAERASARAGAQRSADDRAAERYMRFGRVEGEPAKPAAAASAPAATPGAAADASAQRDADAAARKAAASEGGAEAWRAARDRQNEQRLAELQKKPNITGAEKQEIGRLRARVDESRQRQEAARTPKPAPERVAAAPERGGSAPTRVVNDHIYEELERTRRASEALQDRPATDTDRLRAEVDRTEAEINSAVRDGTSTDELSKRLSQTRGQLITALQKDMADAGAASSAERAASLGSRQQEDERKRGDALAAAANRPQGGSAVVPGQVASAPRPPTTTPEERAASATQRNADEAAAAQKRKEEAAERDRRTEQEAKERALKFGTLPADAFKPIDPAPAAAAAEERRAGQAQRDLDLAAAAERRKREMAAAEAQSKREAGERILKFGGNAPPPAAAPPVKPVAVKPEPPLQLAALKRDPLPLVPPTPPPGYVSEPQPTASPNDATPANGRPLGEGDPKSRELYLAGLQQQLEKRLDGSEFARTAIPAMFAAFADQLGPAATDALLAAVLARLGTGKIDAARFLEALFTEVDARAAASGDAEAARMSRMAHASALDALVNDNPPGSAGLTDAQRATLGSALHTLAQKLIEENRALAAAGSDPVAQAQRQAEILKLAGMLGPQDQTARTTAEAAAKSLAQLMAGLKSDPARVALPADLANALQALERSFATLPGGVAPAVVESLAGALGDGYNALAASLRRASGGDPAAKAALIVEAEGREARARLATGRAADALAALAPRSGEDASNAAAREAQRGALLERIVTLYPGLSAEERGRIGDIEKLKAERLASLRSALATERDPARIAGHAVPLIRALEAAGQAADALKTASDAAARAPNDDMLQGEKLRLQLLAQGTAPGDAAKLLEGVPAESRPAAVALALDGLAQTGRVDLIDALAAAAAASLRSNPTLANALVVQADLAAVDALSLAGGDPKALSDRITATRSRLSLESGLPLDLIRTFSTALDQVEARARSVRGWRQALDSGTPPAAGGFLGVAREALQAGRLDIAAEAVNRSLAGLAGASGDVALRQLAEAQALSSMMSQRLAAPDVSVSQRAAGKAFLDAVAAPLRKGLASVTEHQRKLLGDLVSTRNDTQQTRDNFSAGYDAALQRLREAARISLELDLPGMTNEQRSKRIGGRIGELNQQIHEKHVAIRKEFAGFREEVRTGVTRELLDRRLAELDALRAERDGLQDHQLDAERSVEVQLRVGPPQQVDSRAAALWELERRLNGWNQGDGTVAWDDIKRTFGASVQGRTRGLRGDRITQQLRDANPDNWLDTIMVGNEGDYYERRRAQVIMEDPRKTGEQRRAALQQTYRFEADMYKRQGDSYLFNEITGTGEADLNRARERYGQVENQRLSWLRSDLERAGKSGDPQGFFRSLVGLREAQLAGQIDAYQNYMDVQDKTKLGPVRRFRIRSSGAEAVGDALDAASVADAQLHPALIRAGHRPPSDLSAEDRQILTDAGFMRDGRYVIPRTAVEDLIRVTTAGTDFAKESTIDKYVNVRAAAELAVTVVLPGGFSSRIAGSLVSRIGMREIAKAAGARQAAGLIATWAGSRVASKVVEAGLFTVTSRAARTLLDPTFVADQMEAGWSGLGAEYAHNLMVIGALGVAGSGMNLARRSGAAALGARIADKWAYAGYAAATGAALIVTEAALLTGLDRLASGNAITQEDFIGNLLTVGMLKAMHGPGADLRGGGGEIGQLSASARRYEAWNREQVYVRLANSPAGEMLRKQFNGSWDAARKAHKAGTITDAQMDMLLELRGNIVDKLIAEIKGELGGDAKALGSVNRGSDYDLSFSGPKAELAVYLFNARFGNAWRQAAGFGGAEAAARLDTNIYTRPVFDTIGKGGAVDAWVQEGFAQLQARRNMDSTQWKTHIADTLSTVTDPVRRVRMEELLNKVDQRHGEFEKMVAERLPSAAAELGLARESVDADRAARNRLYEETLLQMMGLNEARTKTTDPAQRAELEVQLRQLQSRALYFAAEAYMTQAAINHVVDSVQSTKRAINAITLLTPGKPGTGEVQITEDFARQSLVEQKGYIAHYLHLGGAPVALSLKVGKYFIRVLDAMQLAGRQLASREELVRLTGLIDARRGGTEDQVARALAAREMIRELRQKPGANSAELNRLEQRLQAERDAYDKAGKTEKEERALSEDAVTTEVLDGLGKMGAGPVDAAANRAAARYNQLAEQALRDFTVELSRTQGLDVTAQQRFRRRNKLRRRLRAGVPCGGSTRRSRFSARQREASQTPGC